MKKTIILTILGLGLLSSMCDAQVKKQFFPSDAEMQTKLSIRINFTAIELNNYSFVLKQGGPDAIMRMTNISAAQASQLLSDYSKFIDSTRSAADKVFGKWYKESSDKWAADTLASAKKGGKP